MTATAVTLLMAWPLREALLHGGLPGSGPDVVSSTWGMWWATLEPVNALIGGWTSIANYPYGVRGVVLAPSSALTFGLTAPLVGNGYAASLSALVQLVGLAAGVAWLSVTLGVRRWGALAAAMALSTGQVLYYATGEASVVAIAALPLPIGLAALHRTHSDPSRAWRWAALGAACIAAQAIENPYLAPILPAAGALALALAWRAQRQGQAAAIKPLLAALGGGAVGVLVIASIFGQAANPDYPREVAGDTLSIGPILLDVVDLPWARADLFSLFLPGDPAWVLTGQDAAATNGGHYLGWTMLVLAGVGVATARARAIPWLLLGVGCVIIALGSIPFGPFSILNAIMDVIARPLTQPVRFLVPGVIGLAILAGMGVQAAVSRWPYAGPIAAGALIIEGLTVGGLGLHLPQTPVPDSPCLAKLQEREGGLLLWPWDGDTAGFQGKSKLAQMAHVRPGPHHGIASWALTGRHRTPDLLFARGFAVPAQASGAALDTPHLKLLGYRWIVVDRTARLDADPSGQLAGRLTRGLGTPAETCDDYTVYDLGPLGKDWRTTLIDRGDIDPALIWRLPDDSAAGKWHGKPPPDYGLPPQSQIRGPPDPRTGKPHPKK